MHRFRSLIASGLLLAIFGLILTTADGQPDQKRPKKNRPSSPDTTYEATPLDHLRVKEGFQVELIYSVPKDTQGSWVCLCVAPGGQLIASDQYGKLYRVSPPPLGGKGEAQIQAIPVDIGEAQGLLWAFDSLYVSVNRGEKYASGLYRVTDENGDGELDTVKMLRELQGGGEHGPHALILTPDGESIIICCGNHTDPTKFDQSRVPMVWDEDQLLPRMWDAGGHARGRLAPGGWIARTDPNGETWELISAGYRNEYDAAFNMDGDLFTYDSDMEWDMNAPWYRPTRVCFAASGSDFGWRSGTGKFPPYYPDSYPAVVDIGPGSPTGVTFGYGAKFPAKYQEAFFICDWSYGKLYAVHLDRVGGGYTGTFEEFVTGTPLPLTDIVVHPEDGAMYFAIGGRRAQSGLYRITYVGDESTAPSDPEPDDLAALALRAKLELYHGNIEPEAVETAWPHLQSEDRALRYAARIAIESQPIDGWLEQALAEKHPQASMEALLAVVRHAEDDVQPRVLDALARLDFDALTYEQKLALVRIYALTFIRLGEPDEATRKAAIERFDPLYPARGKELNAELSKMLVYLEAPSAAEKTMALLRDALTQEEQIDYALALRELDTGWTPELREEYFRWYQKAAHFKGGNSLEGFVRNIKTEAIAHLSPEEQARLKPILEAQVEPVEVAIPPRPFVKDWKLDELIPLVENGLKGRDFDNGRRIFAATTCFACHRFGNEGGSTGPDLTGVAGRFSTRDLLESLVEPNKTISDQYQSVNVFTKDDRIISGRIVNIFGDEMAVNTDGYNPNALERVNRENIAEIEPSAVSMMPQGLLNTLNEEEILDLIAYLMSRGDPDHAMFQE